MKPGSPRFKVGDYVQPIGVKNPEYLLRIVGLYNPSKHARFEEYKCQWVHPDMQLKDRTQWLPMNYVDGNFDLTPAALVILFGET